MKHILPILTLTTLAAAASAQSAASSGLSYNQVSLTYVRTSVSGFSGHLNDWQLSASALIGSSNVLLAAQTSVGGDLGNGADAVYAGYVFKNLGGFADVIPYIGSDEQYGVRLRKELGANFEASLSYQLNNNAGNVFGAAVGYNITKQVSVDLGYAHLNSYAGIPSANEWSLGLRYNF